MTTKQNKIILNDEETNELVAMINAGIGIAEILATNSFGLSSEKCVRRIAKECDLYNRLKLNNQLYKSKAIKNSNKQKQLKKTDEIDKKYGKLIYSLLLSGYTVYDIAKKIEVCKNQLYRFIEYKQWSDIKNKNTKRKLYDTAVMNGRKSADVLAGVELKPITNEIINRFEELKRENLYKSQIYNIIKKEFGFKRNKFHQLCQQYGEPRHSSMCGEENPLFGKTPSKKCGIGVKCWVVIDGKKIFCRSSLELKIFLYLIDNKIKFELSKHRIKYIDNNGNFRTYNPDIVLLKDNVICEIKPSKLINQEINKLKISALQSYCDTMKLKCRYLTESTFDISNYNKEKMLNLIDNGSILIDNENKEKLLKYL